MNEQDRQTELQYLSTTLAEIEKQLKLHEDVCSGQQSQLKSTLANYWSEKGGNVGDEAQFVEAVVRQRAISSVIHTAALQLRRMLDSPYFGRMDFAEDGANSAPEKIYIGIATLISKETNEFLIYDWRAPISGMYYDFEPGKAWYQCPEEKVTGTITLKRQYKISKGQMEYMFNADLNIDDEVLREILGKSADDKMHTIVTSIQREQNKIIRNDEYRALFVEGPAGSGKTSVALHRIAFLLYRDRERITAKNVLILSPNHLFSDYISNVLPEIGEENVPQMTFQDYVTSSTTNMPITFESRTAHLENLLINSEDRTAQCNAARIQYKSSPEFEQALIAYLEWIQTSLVNSYPAIEYRGNVYFSSDEWKKYYLDAFSSMPPILRLEKIRTMIHTRLRPAVHTVRAEKEEEIAAAGEEVSEKVIKALARIAAKEEMSSLFQQVNKLTSLVPLAEYRRLFEENRLISYLPKQKLPLDWQQLRKQTLASLNKGVLPYEDIPPFLYFQGVLQGFPVRQDILHLVIDEAQDYTALQYKILIHLFPNCSWTVVGDTAQAVHPYLKTANFSQVCTLINIPQSHMFVLTRSYRSTTEIQAFCQALLPHAVMATPINRPGPKPTVTRITPASQASALLQDIQAYIAEGWHSIAVIAKTIAEARQIFSALQDSVPIRLIDTDEAAFQQGIVVIPSFLAKGLEFDAVLVSSVDSVSYGKEEERHLLYTVCTRSLHRLSLFYSGTLSPFLAAMDAQLFESKIF